jgi:outer membrane protein W
MIKRIILNIILVFIIGTKLYAQNIEEEIPVFKIINPITIKKSYQLSFRPSYFKPLGGTRSYISSNEIKPLNFSFEIVQPKEYSIGVDIGQQYFSQYKAREVYDYDGTIISTAQMRTIKNTPIVFTYSKYFSNIENTFRPYAQLGLGIVHIAYKNYWGYILDDKTRIAPSIAPAIGFKLNLDESNNWVIDGKVKYIIAPFKYDFISKLNYLVIDLSLGFRWWDE